MHDLYAIFAIYWKHEVGYIILAVAMFCFAKAMAVIINNTKGKK